MNIRVRYDFSRREELGTNLSKLEVRDNLSIRVWDDLSKQEDLGTI
jgi:hypothetical protein